MAKAQYEPFIVNSTKAIVLLKDSISFDIFDITKIKFTLQ